MFLYSNKRLIIFIVIVVALPRVFWVSTHIVHTPRLDSIMPDQAEYHAVGINIAEGKGFITPETGFGNEYYRASPLFPAFVGSIYWLMGKDASVVQWVQVIVAIGTGILLLLLGNALIGRRASIIAVLIFAIHPYQIYYTALLQPATLSVFIFVLLSYLVVRQYSFPSFYGAVLTGVGFGLMSLARNPFFPLPFLWVAVILLHGRNRLLNARYGLVAILFAILVYSPWIIRNSYAFDGFYIFPPNYASNVLLRQNLDGQTLIEVYGRSGTDTKEYDQVAMKAFLSEITNRPGAFVLRCLKKLKRAYRIVPTGIGTYEGDLGAGIKICMGFWNVMIFILAIVAVPSLVRRQPLIAFSLFSIVTITLIHLPFSASTRKMLPIMPHFFILAAYSIALLIDRLSYVYSKLTKK